MDLTLLVIKRSFRKPALPAIWPEFPAQKPEDSTVGTRDIWMPYILPGIDKI